jgi:hypothetical protein
VLFCGGLALLALRLMWWWRALRRARREIAACERALAEQAQEVRYLRSVQAELNMVERLIERSRNIDDVARWQ